MYVPMYPYGQIGCLLNKKYCPLMKQYKMMDVAKINRDIPIQIEKTLKYYSKEMHKASFVTPKFLHSAL